PAAPPALLAVGHLEHRAGPQALRLQLARVDVELQVPEAVHPEDLADDAPVLLPGEGDEPRDERKRIHDLAQLAQLDPRRQVTGGRSEDVAAGKGGARALELVLGVG